MYSGGERQENPARATSPVGSREEVEQREERGLAAVGDGDVALAQLPAVLAPEESGERAGEASVALRPVVAPDRLLECPASLHERLHARPEDVLRGGYVTRVAAAEVDDVAVPGRDGAEVVHERARAGLARQPLPECR